MCKSKRRLIKFQFQIAISKCLMLEETTNLNNYLENAWLAAHVWLEVHLGHSAALHRVLNAGRPVAIPLQSCCEFGCSHASVSIRTIDSRSYFKPRRDKMVKNKSALN